MRSSLAKLDYAELACKPYSIHLKKNVLQKKAFWKKWWKFKFKTNIHVSLFILDCSWKKKEFVFFFPLFLLWFVVFAVKDKNTFIVNRMTKFWTIEVGSKRSRSRIISQKDCFGKNNTITSSFRRQSAH